MKKSVKLADIARKSNLSTSTVSLVLRGKPGIPHETRQRVLRVARQLGYRPRKSVRAAVNARRQGGGTLRTVGLIVKTEPQVAPQANPFYAHVLAGIESACRQQRIDLLYATLPVDENNVPGEVPRLLSETPLDGLLLVGIFVDDVLQHLLLDKEIPVVLVDAYSAADRYDAVVSDNSYGAGRAVHYLVGRGHRHIGFIGGGANAYPSLRERRQGYAQAMREHALTPVFADCLPQPEAVALQARRLLDQQPQLTAWVGCNDEVAAAALRTAQAAGRNVPRDLSLIGFDDIELAAHLMPPLTTLHLDKAGMGRMAMQLLAQRVQFPQTERLVAVIRPRLVERESVADCWSE